MKVKTVICLVLALLFVLPAAGSDPKKDIPDYSTTPRNDIPTEFTWKIDDIYPTMADWKKDKEALLALTKRIDTTAENWTASPKNMLALQELLNTIRQKAIRLFSFASHQSNADLGNPTFQQMKGETRTIFIKLRSKTAFINDDILKLGKAKFDEYLAAEPRLKPYAFGFNDVFRRAPHILPTDQQKISAMTGLFSGAPARAAGMLNNMELPKPEITLANGEKIVLNYANYAKHRASKIRADRDLVMKTFWENQKKFENTFAVLFDGGMKNHLFNARVRKFKDCLESRLNGDNIDPAVYHNLIKYVRENLEPFHRYLALKKEMLKLDVFNYADMYASSVKSVDKKYTYDEAMALVLAATQPLGTEYTRMLKHGFDNRWVDVYPNKGKQSGAYSGGLYGVHPFVKMNYDGSYDTLSTLAHEMGHAMHSYFSNKTQPYPTTGYSAFLAEIASTFNENMLLQHLLDHEKDDLLKLFILDSFIQQVKGTIYRQTQFAEFELAMHREVEKGGTLTPQWLNKKYLELARDYYGHEKGVVRVDDYIAVEWASVPHFFMNYYVYTYSTGMIASMALSDMVLNGGKDEQDKYLAFLSAGGSRYPLDTLKTAGVDMTTPVPYQAAFKRFRQLVSRMEDIVKRLKNEG